MFRWGDDDHFLVNNRHKLNFWFIRNERTKDNILKGDMSVVGNRPLPLYEAERLTNDESIERFMAPAGLTGLWQVEKRGDAGKLSAKERKELDLKYGREFSFFLDMKILFKTLTAFVQKGDV